MRDTVNFLKARRGSFPFRYQPEGRKLDLRKNIPQQGILHPRDKAQGSGAAAHADHPGGKEMAEVVLPRIMKRWCSCLWPDLVEGPAGWTPRSSTLIPARRQRDGHCGLLQAAGKSPLCVEGWAPFSPQMFTDSALALGPEPRRSDQALAVSITLVSVGQAGRPWMWGGVEGEGGIVGGGRSLAHPMWGMGDAEQ